MRSLHRYSDEDLARFIHEMFIALQILQHRNGVFDPAPVEPWASFPDHLKRVTTEGVRRVRRGTTYREHQAAWVADMTALGWVRGPKDRAARTHPDLIPYDEMNQFQKDKIRMFYHAVTQLTVEE